MECELVPNVDQRRDGQSAVVSLTPGFIHEANTSGIHTSDPRTSTVTCKPLRVRVTGRISGLVTPTRRGLRSAVRLPGGCVNAHRGNDRGHDRRLRPLQASRQRELRS